MGRRPLTEGQKAEKAARRRERERQQRLVARQAKQIEDAETHIVSQSFPETILEDPVVSSMSLHLSIRTLRYREAAETNEDEETSAAETPDSRTPLQSEQIAATPVSRYEVDHIVSPCSQTRLRVQRYRDRRHATRLQQIFQEATECQDLPFTHELSALSLRDDATPSLSLPADIPDNEPRPSSVPAPESEPEFDIETSVLPLSSSALSNVNLLTEDEEDNRSEASVLEDDAASQPMTPSLTSPSSSRHHSSSSSSQSRGSLLLSRSNSSVWSDLSGLPSDEPEDLILSDFLQAISNQDTAGGPDFLRAQSGVYDRVLRKFFNHQCSCPSSHERAEPENTHTLQEHTAEPGPEVSAHPNNVHICTAVGQYLAFTLMALGSPGERRGNRQEERLKAMKNLKTWAEDFESTLRSIPENERSASSDYSPGHEPTTYKDVNRSPALLRKRTRRTAACQAGEGSLRKDDRQEPSDDESAPRPPDTPTPSGRNTRQGTRRSQRLALLALRPRGGGGGEQGRQDYCTQKCLVGMVKGGFLDPKCPNVALHGKSCAPAARARHPVDHKEWLRLLWKQLKQSLDDGIRPLGEGGARGVVFQVTLLAHGYTFVSKGTVRAFIKDLEHEAAVYERLKPIQGVHVPVFLGAIDLGSMNKTYYYDHRAYVVHMTFLSWGGCSIDRAQRIGDTDRPLEDEAIRSLRAMHREGVVHKDVRLANMLFNPETNRVMVIDFERALLLKPPRRPLAQLVPNKRAWKSETMMDAKKVTGDSSRRSQPSQKLFRGYLVGKDGVLGVEC
uniref:EKC/KEOPS complex subunit BUD32 n=1 Tax=Fusarium oxysporum (strain Fo5176) TaxID=660025 RepID=A0A0C4DJS1_FUSOF